MSAGEAQSLARVVLDNKVVQIPLAQADGLQDVLPAALEGLVFHLDHRIPAVADVVQSRDKGAPVHIAQPRDLRRHVVQRIGQHAALLQLLGIELDILEVDVEEPVFELIDRLQVVQPLPHIMAGIEVQSEVRTRAKLEKLF